MNVLIQVNNVVKWTLLTGNSAHMRQVSESFAFQNRKCAFVFFSGFNNSGPGNEPITLSIDFQEKGKDVTLQMSKASKILFPLAKVSVTGENVIWSSFDYTLRNSELTFEMTIPHILNDKSVQTASYIDTRFSLEESSKDYAKLLDNGPNHDAEFAIGDQIIKAHKSILCCRSDVFTSMFQIDMVEGNTGRVNIQDMDVTIFRQFLEYLYTGMLPELTVDIAMQLYVASNKYAVNVLKLQCADFLVHNLSFENVCEILVLADLHKDVQFKKSVMEYICKEKLPVKLEKEKWSDFCNENKDLAIEVYDSFCGYFWQQ